jgi:hypothetical protein
MLQGFLLQVEVVRIVAREADEPNAVIGFLDTEFLAGQHGGNIDSLAMQVEASPKCGFSALSRTIKLSICCRS